MALRRPSFESLELTRSYSYHLLDIHETKSLDDSEDDPIKHLRKKHSEILKCIKIIKKGIRKRNLPIQIAMLLVALGTTAYMISNWIKYNEFKDSVPELQKQLRNQISSIENTIINLHHSYRELMLKMAENLYCNSQKTLAHCFDFLCKWNLRFEASLHYCTYYPYYETHFYTPECRIIDPKWAINRLVPCMDMQNGENCFDILKSFCKNDADIENASFSIHAMKSRIVALNDPSAIFYETTRGIFMYYFLTCGFGEIAPSLIILLTFLTHIFTDCLTSPRLCFNLSQDDTDDVMDITKEHNIDCDLSSYPKMLKKFQTMLPEIDNKINAYESRLAFCMAEKEKDEKNTPLIRFFHDSNLSEPKLAKIIFDMAGLTDDSQLLSSSRKTRRTFERAALARNALPNHLGKSNPLFTFFDKIQNQSSNVSEYEYKQGKNSKNDVLRNIYEFAGLIPISKE